MKRALIGHTGLVGSNLDAQVPFAARYNSANFREMEGASFDEVWCAGIQAVKWWANQNPEEDWGRIKALLDVLAGVRCGRFVLVSTVDVYRDPVGVDEGTETPEEGLQPYGLHRLRAEGFVARRFPGALALRLPGLFGPGLKKNAIYDLAHGNAIDALDGGSVFQFYDLSRLAADAQAASSAGLRLANLATEPVRLGDVATRVFGRELPVRAGGARYDMRTRHGSAFGRADAPYLAGAGEVMAGIARYAASVAPRGDRP